MYIGTTGTGATSAGTGTSTPLVNQSAVLGYTRTLSPNTVVESHFAVVRWNANIRPPDLSLMLIPGK